VTQPSAQGDIATPEHTAQAALAESVISGAQVDACAELITKASPVAPPNVDPQLLAEIAEGRRREKMAEDDVDRLQKDLKAARSNLEQESKHLGCVVSGGVGQDRREPADSDSLGAAVLSIAKVKS
jgi:hypothetical protein